ncbi:MAG: L-threonylcarbamoyladenylate synthase [Synechococcales cyanobacterium]
MTRIWDPTPDHIAYLGSRLRAGELVAMPTETVYGLAGNMWDPQAVARIFAVKERPHFDPLIVHLPLPGESLNLGYLQDQGVVRIDGIPVTVRPVLEALLRACWPGPLTVVLPRSAGLLDLVTSGLETVAVRIPNHPVAQALLRAAQVPLAAPSANRFGRISPTTAAAVEQELQGRIDHILDGGRCGVGVESTIVVCHGDGSWQCLRPGGIPVEVIQAYLGPERSESPQEQPLLVSRQRTPSQLAPGQLDSHYAPRTPFFRLDSAWSHLPPTTWQALRDWVGSRKVGILVWQGDPATLVAWFQSQWHGSVRVWSLSPDGDPVTAAQQLFQVLRELDASGSDVLLTEPIPLTTGLGPALQDRLRRASTLWVAPET